MKKTNLVKDKLLQESNSIKERIVSLEASDPFKDPDYANDNAATDTDAREQEAHQRIEAELETLKKRMQNIDQALQAIDKGLYGKCKKCGISIPEKRLELVPEALYCVVCENSLIK